MEIRIFPTRSLSGTVTVPPSKSCTHRAVILASLARGKSIVKNPLISEDTAATIEACEAVGAKIKSTGEELLIEGIDGKPKKPAGIINVRNSGTTLRIMSAVACLCPGEVSLSGDESIQKRPMQPLLDALRQLGAKTKSVNGNPPVTVQGPLSGGVCKIRGDISSQYISGLLIAAPLSQEKTEIDVMGKIKSRPYIDLTLDILDRFGGRVDHEGSIFRMEGRQIYKSNVYKVEGDYSSAALVMAAAALTDSEVKLINLRGDSKQGDRKMIDILRKMGAFVHTGEDSVTVRGGSELVGLKLDLSDNPDIVPPVAVVASLAKGKTVLDNIEHLRFKESDRLKALETELSKMGAKIKAGSDYLEIHGVSSLKGAKLHGYNDHRIVMALAAAGLRAEGETIIDSAESIPVSFPGYVEAMQALGAEIKPSA